MKGRGDIAKAVTRRSKSNRYRKLLTILSIAKTFTLYFCLPFALALSFALFITYPRGQLSSEVADWRDSGYSYDFKGKEIFYQDIARLTSKRQGEDLLLLHGFPTSSYDWKKVVFPMVGRFRRIIATDMLGFGFSDKPIYHNYTVFEQALLHENLLQDLGITSVHILAHDLGDTVAQEMLSRYLERSLRKESGLIISSLCLSNGGIFPETHHPRLIQKLLRVPVIGQLSAYLMSYVFFERSFAAIFGNKTQPSPKELWDFWTILRYNDGHLATPGQLKYIDERRSNRERWVGALKESTIPLHYIYGAMDPINPAAALERYRNILPHSSITVLPQAGHYPHWEDEKGFLKGYLEFLDRIGVVNGS